MPKESDWLNIPLGYFAEIYRSMRSGSAMAPFLAMDFLAIILALPCILWGNLVAQVFAIALIASTFLSTIIKGFYFMKCDPSQLRTDQHGQTMRALEMFGDKDNPFRADATHVVALISNPSSAEALPPAKESND